MSEGLALPSTASHPRMLESVQQNSSLQFISEGSLERCIETNIYQAT